MISVEADLCITMSALRGNASQDPPRPPLNVAQGDQGQACPTSLNSKPGMPVAFSSASSARLRSTPPA